MEGIIRTKPVDPDYGLHISLRLWSTRNCQMCPRQKTTRKDVDADGGREAEAEAYWRAGVPLSSPLPSPPVPSAARDAYRGRAAFAWG